MATGGFGAPCINNCILLFLLFPVHTCVHRRREIGMYMTRTNTEKFFSILKLIYYQIRLLSLGFKFLIKNFVLVNTTEVFTALTPKLKL